MPSLQAIDPKKYILTVNSVPITGIADIDDAILFEVNEDRYGDPAMDLSGSGVHIRNSNGSGKATVAVKDSSLSLGYLQVLLDTDIKIVSVVAIDRNSPTAKAFGKDGRIMRPPNWGKGKTITDNVFVFTCVEIQITHGTPFVLPI